MEELARLLKQAFDEVYTTSNDLQVGVGLRRVVNMYMHGDSLSLTLRRPDRVLVITRGRVQLWDGHEKHGLETSLSISSILIDNNKLYIILELGS